MEYNEYRGIRGLCVAEVTADAGTYTVDKWHRLSGAQSVALSSNESNEAHYYDNVPAIVVSSEGADEVTLTVSVLDNKTRAFLEGREFVENSGMLVKTPKKNKVFALGFIGKKTNGEEEFNILYKGRFTGGGETHNTEDDGTEGTNVEYTFTGIYTTSPIYASKPAKSVKVKPTTKITEAKVFGEFTGDVSDVSPLTPDAIAALETV